MPKELRSSSFDRRRPSPYSSCQNNADNRRAKPHSLPVGNENEWEEVRCSVCMEYPHNAVLLQCSSRDKGCRPYMCDTGSRHSNCLDRFRKLTAKSGTPEEVSAGEQTKLVCPLCRGHISGWTVIEPARHFMNSKTRSCSLETCNFSGNYSELRRHARREHPHVRPTDVNPERELEWASLEEEREQQDMLSMQFELDDFNDFDMEYFDYELPSAIWVDDYDLDMLRLQFEFNDDDAFDMEYFNYEVHGEIRVDDHDLDFQSSLSGSQRELGNRSGAAVYMENIALYRVERGFGWLTRTSMGQPRNRSATPRANMQWTRSRSNGVSGPRNDVQGRLSNRRPPRGPRPHNRQ